MIDIQTGELISDSGNRIGPNIKRDMFLASEISENATIFVKNEPWCSYRVAELRISGLNFIIILFFYGQDLNRIDMLNSNPQFGETWNDWSEEKELQRKESHEKWLDKIIGSKRNFSWGNIDSVYDQKSGTSLIIITYK